MSERRELYIGWGKADITPTEPVLIRGQFHARVSEGVRDPIAATALALETSGENGSSDWVIMVSCDLVSISDPLRDDVRRLVKDRLPGGDATHVVLHATHTHTAPEIDPDDDGYRGVDLEVMEPKVYVAWAADKIAAAVLEAWENRCRGGISWGLGHAVVGHNRLWTSLEGVSTMYRNTGDAGFSHIEGYTDHALNVLCTWSPAGDLTGVVVNLACPSQVSEHEFMISADYWHETREALRRQFGDDIFVLPQCSPAGDQSPHHIYRRPAEERMLELKGLSRREEIASDIAAEIERIVPSLRAQIEWRPTLRHTIETLALPRRMFQEEQVNAALTEAQEWREHYEKLVEDLEANPQRKEESRWYIDVSRAYRRAVRGESVAARFKKQREQPNYPVELHVIRLADAVFATNPFEYYLDYAIRIHSRSRATQNFLVQLAGPGTYVPTARSEAGGAYGAVPASTIVGSVGGTELANRTVERINELFETRVSVDRGA